MTAARTLTDADLDAIADRVVAKLRAPPHPIAGPARVGFVAALHDLVKETGTFADRKKETRHG
ncbi:MAG TPA: hypothetical protein VLT45_05900 [Kofleriaceae bacterium]|nr:hypothetical protein [Kofleriaceae bacterium]